MKTKINLCFLSCKVPRESSVPAPFRLSGESSPAIPLHRQGVLGEPRRVPGSEASRSHGAAEREDAPPAHLGQQAPTDEGPVTKLTRPS